MTTSTTMTIRLDPQLKAKLGRLADGTRRSRSFLAAEAVETYVDRNWPSSKASNAGLRTWKPDGRSAMKMQWPPCGR